MGIKALVRYYSLYYRHEISIFIIIFAVALLCISIKYDTLLKGNKIIKYFGELSMYVYIIHWGVLYVVEYASANYVAFLSNAIVELIVVMFISLMLSYSYIFLKRNLKKERMMQV